MSEYVYERALRAVERYGLGVCLAAALLWFARVDIIVPMVKSHQQFLGDMTETTREMSRTQTEISRALNDQTKTLETQTRLLYTLCPRIETTMPVEAGKYATKSVQDTEPQN